MLALARISSAAICLAIAVGAAPADEADLSLGGFICVRPFAPACVNAPATYGAQENVASCQVEVERFVNATAAYRNCLQGQIAGAVSRVNDIVDRFRCRARLGACPPSSPGGAKPNARAN
jgi:hypothetical protein